MEIKTDISTQEEIKQLVDSFYNKVKSDDLIGVFFTNTIHIDWDKHMPVMYQFWSSVLFGTGGYAGNPIVKHINLNQIRELKVDHFNRWIMHWDNTVDELFCGSTATEAKTKARNMMNLMILKLDQSENDYNIL